MKIRLEKQQNLKVPLGSIAPFILMLALGGGKL